MMPYEIVASITGMMIDWDVTFEHKDIRHSPNVLGIANEIKRMIITRMRLPWCWQGEDGWWIAVLDSDNATWRNYV